MDNTVTVTVTVETARLLLAILGQVTLAVGSPDFDDMALPVLTAKQELTAALAET